MKEIILAKNDNCTGCGACLNACPLGAIEMVRNSDEYLVPKINKEICTACGNCVQSCPMLKTTLKNNPKPECYAVMCKDEMRLRSSSGGVFGELATDILEKKGFVCGVEYGDDLELKHIVIDDIKDLPKLQGSKYHQSDIGNCYKQIKHLLQDNKTVLFCGCPCQVAGLNSYLKNDYKNLYTLDLVCHGVPSVKIIKEYIKEYVDVSEVEKLEFRDKATFGWSSGSRIDLKTGKKIVHQFKDSLFFKAFLNLGVNKTCTTCKFACLPRQGDMTTGDFWGIEEFNSELSDRKGTSVILVNNDNGKKLLNIIKDRAKVVTKTPIEVATKKNKSILKPYPEHKNRDMFFKLLGTLPLSKVVDRCMNDKFDVGIVSIYTVPNFGGALTYFALYKLIIELGYTAQLIERPLNCQHKPSQLDVAYASNPYPKNALAPLMSTKYEMRAFNDKFDKFVIGSDQLFNELLYHRFGEWCTLDWVKDTKKKIAYAASFGHDKFTGSSADIETMSYFMKKFDYFSVREESGVELAKSAFDIDATFVLDPVFLCDTEHYIALAKNSVNKGKVKNYLSAYILDISLSKLQIISDIAKDKSLSAELYTEMYVTSLTVPNEIKFNTGKIEDRLLSIINSDFVVADSFHGICFAIIFKKQFICILNKGRGATRMISILHLLGLEEYAMEDMQDYLSKKEYLLEIDYDSVYKILNNEVVRCKEWLKNALSDNTQKRLSEYDNYSGLVSKHEFEMKRVLIENNQLKIQMNKLLQLFNLEILAVNDIIKYLATLSRSKDKYVVCLACKDTPGHKFTEEMFQKFKALGLKINLTAQHWHSYAGISINNVANEVLSKEFESVAYKMQYNGITFDIQSASLKSGNYAKIIIDGVDYSKNLRGLNIVVFDIERKRVVDTICFDTHSPDAPYFR